MQSGRSCFWRRKSLCAIPSTSHTINKVIFTALYTINHSTQTHHQPTDRSHEGWSWGQSEACFTPRIQVTCKRSKSIQPLVGLSHWKCFWWIAITNNGQIIKWWSGATENYYKFAICGKLIYTEWNPNPIGMHWNFSCQKLFSVFGQKRKRLKIYASVSVSAQNFYFGCILIN